MYYTHTEKKLPWYEIQNSLEVTEFDSSERLLPWYEIQLWNTNNKSSQHRKEQGDIIVVKNKASFKKYNVSTIVASK